MLFIRKSSFFKAFVCLFIIIFLTTLGCCFHEIFWLKKISGGGYIVVAAAVVHHSHTHGICSEWMPVGQFVFTCVRSSLGKVFFCNLYDKKRSVTLKLLLFFF
jgi:hypothetical protein